LNSHGDEDRYKGDGDEGETEETEESLYKEEEDEEYGADRNLERTDVPTKKKVKAAVDKLKKKVRHQAQMEYPVKY
jgi:hypothetical protein